MGVKLDDHIGCHACSACHDWLDREATPDEYARAFWPAHLETLKRVEKEGLL
jgi:nitrate reductase beta subunit